MSPVELFWQTDPTRSEPAGHSGFVFARAKPATDMRPAVKRVNANLRMLFFQLLSISAGVRQPIRAHARWVCAVAGSPDQIQIMYGVAGERWLPELVVPWLPGYENSSPVRIGNAAHQQLQIDVTGEVIDAMALAWKAGMEISERGRAMRPLILEYLAKAWREPDEGIWEVRGGRQHFVHSKVMAWVAFDRSAAALAVEGSGEEANRWRAVADEIHAEVCERGFDRELNSFVQAYGSKRLDASLLLM